MIPMAAPRALPQTNKTRACLSVCLSTSLRCCVRAPLFRILKPVRRARPRTGLARPPSAGLLLQRQAHMTACPVLVLARINGVPCRLAKQACHRLAGSRPLYIKRPSLVS